MSGKHFIERPDLVPGNYLVKAVKENFNQARIFTLFSSIFLFYFGIKSYISGLHLYGTVILGFGIYAVINYLVMGGNKYPEVQKKLIVLMMGILCLILLYSGGQEGSGPLWFYVFPLLALFVLGFKQGLIAILLLILSSLVLITIAGVDFDTSVYTDSLIERFPAVFIAVTVMSLLYEYNQQRYSERMQELYAEMAAAARTDYLTNLPNRRYMHENLDYELSRAKRNKLRFSVLICDVDYFKDINDMYGHDCGDKVLQSISRFFSENLRAQDKIARWGGEEFLMLLPDTSLSGAKTIAEQLRTKIEKEVVLQQHLDCSISLSFGVVEVQPGDDLEDVLHKADRNLYLAKSQGRNRVVAE